MTVSAKVSKLMTEGKVKTAIRTAKLINGILFFIGVIGSIILLSFTDGIISCLVSEDQVDAKEYIKKLIYVFSITCPITTLHNGVLSFARSIGQQNKIFIMSLFSNYVVHFGIAFLLIYAFKLDCMSMWIGFTAGLLVFSVGGLILCSYFVDWETESRKIQKSVID